MSQQAVIANADSQPSKDRMQQDADTNRRPGGLPENRNDPQVHGKDETSLNGSELVANGDVRSGRQGHTDLRHAVSSNAYLHLLPRPAVFILDLQSPC